MKAIYFFLVGLFSLILNAQSSGFIINSDNDSINVEFKVRNLTSHFENKNFKLQSEVKYTLNGKKHKVHPNQLEIIGFCINGVKNKLICYDLFPFDLEGNEAYMFFQRLTGDEKSPIQVWQFANPFDYYRKKEYLVHKDESVFRIGYYWADGKKDAYTFIEQIVKDCPKLLEKLKGKETDGKIYSAKEFENYFKKYNKQCSK